MKKMKLQKIKSVKLSLLVNKEERFRAVVSEPKASVSHRVWVSHSCPRFFPLTVGWLAFFIALSSGIGPILIYKCLEYVCGQLISVLHSSFTFLGHLCPPTPKSGF